MDSLNQSPHRGSSGGPDNGPRNVMLDRQNPDLLNSPSTDHGLLPNLKFSFSMAHTRIEEGGWTREVTQRELMVIILNHMHEHLGQSIAYARMNGVTPPWSEATEAPKSPAKS